MLKLAAQGLRNKEIGARLGVSLLTAEGHMRNIMAKLDVQDRTEAVTIAIRRGIIHIE